MTETRTSPLHQKIDAGIRVAVTQAIERHRQLGESIALWRDGQVIVLKADQIPTIQNEQQLELNDEEV